jgi:NAD(P)-dependent dehydrogenase (short-subunit alcohol dehydrogenase family)
LKIAIDYNLDENINIHNLDGHVAIVTGGNSGIGFSTAKHLVRLNCNVVMACRSMDKCDTAVKEIQSLFPQNAHLINPMLLDLNDLQSIYNFTTLFKSKYQRLDYLINNAGLVAPVGRRTKQGLEELIGSMHIGHFALTKWLLDFMIKPIENNDNMMNPSRIINVASEAFIVGNFHPTIFNENGKGDFEGEVTDNCPIQYGFMPCCPMNACPYTNGYSRAKLANIFHLQELQKRYDEFVYDYTHNKQQSGHSILNEQTKQPNPLPFRRLVTASLHPGAVQTNIAPLLKNSPHFMRDTDEAAYVVLYAIFDDSYIPSSFIDSMKGNHDLIHYQQFGLEKHLATFGPFIHSLPFVKKATGYALDVKGNFSMHSYAWDRTTFIQPMIPELEGKSNTEIAHLVKIRLWDISENIVANWMNGEKDLLGTPVTTIPFSLTLPTTSTSAAVREEEKEQVTEVVVADSKERGEEVADHANQPEQSSNEEAAPQQVTEYEPDANEEL